MELTLVEQEDIAKGTKSFQFLGKVPFLPGQYLILELKGENHAFSFANSPTEEGILIATRMSSSTFKKNLDVLKKGEKINAKGPFGMLRLKEDEEVVMICGGIGITPFRSMIKYATDKKLKTKITLFYFNKILEEIAFQNDLEVMAAQNKNFKVVFVITDPKESKQKWFGEKGFLTKEMLLNNLENETLENKTFYLCGPAGAVSNFSSLLMKEKVPLNKIITESFSGYK